ncbi:FH2 domain-containing protein [Naegleria gruberi]|uniref:FH2 domain-containing protein n=1 Tax=Naegleria gruberi TaxID=5762 RepID=D2VW50_NAEGR|nr:FH2 domain-containing protein [Naegleria gruberi]EFC39015.1 FH2 domain-containing protein [Naegleria gruberi]|eukprot:XP_002671759.1 FH2 domain-containing protein [Naegleria gruberi strain NEG-M]
MEDADSHTSNDEGSSIHEQPTLQDVFPSSSSNNETNLNETERSKVTVSNNSDIFSSTQHITTATEQPTSSAKFSSFTEHIFETLIDRPTTNMTGFFLANDMSEVLDTSTIFVPENNFNLSQKLISIIENGCEEILQQFKDSNYDSNILKTISEVLEVCVDRIDEEDSENSNDMAKDSKYSKWISDFLTGGGLTMMTTSLDHSELVSDKINKDRIPLEVHFLKCTQKLLDASEFSREFFLKDRDALRALVLILDCESLELRAEALLLLTAILNIHIENVDTHALILENFYLFKKIKSEPKRFHFLGKSFNDLANLENHAEEILCKGNSKQYIMALMVFFNGLISKSPNEGIKSMIVKELKGLGMHTSAKQIHLRIEEIIDDLDIDLGKEPIYSNVLLQVGAFEKHFSKYYHDTCLGILEDVDTTNPIEISKSISSYLTSLSNESNQINNIFVNSLNTMLRLTKFGVIKNQSVGEIYNSWKTIDRILKIAINEDKVTFTTETEIEQRKDIEQMRQYILKLENENAKLETQKTNLEKKVKKQEQDDFNKNIINNATSLDEEKPEQVNQHVVETVVSQLQEQSAKPVEISQLQPVENISTSATPPEVPVIPQPPVTTGVPLPPGMNSGIPLPPSGSNSCPTPPVGNVGALSDLPQLPKAKPSTATKPIFLERILNTEVKKTIFVEKKLAENTNELIKKIDLESLGKTFQKVEISKKPAEKEKPANNKPKIEEVKVLDQNKSYMISIQLKSIKKLNKDETDEMKFARLRRGILQMDESYDTELVSCLSKCMPTSEEVESVTKTAEELENLPQNPMNVKVLGLVEKFIYEIRDIPFSLNRIAAWMFKFNLASTAMNIRNKLEIIIGACDQLQNSPSWLNLLSLVLTISNYLNTGNSKMQNLYGFKVSSLSVLEQVKSTDQKKTMIHVLCQLCQEKFPEILKLDSELSNIPKCAPMNFFLIREEIQQFKDEVDSVRKTFKLMESMKEKNLLDETDRFIEIIGPIIEMAETQIVKIDQLLTKAEHSLKSTQELFGEKDIMKDENPNGIPSTISDETLSESLKPHQNMEIEKRTLISIVAHFIQNMTKTHVIVQERREKELREARIQEKQRKKQVGSFFTNLKKLTVRQKMKNAFFGGLAVSHVSDDDHLFSVASSKKPLSCMELIAGQTIQVSSSSQF